MAISHATVAAIVAVYGPKTEGGAFHNKAAGNAAVFMSEFRVMSWINHSLLVHYQLCDYVGTSRLGCLR